MKKILSIVLSLTMAISSVLMPNIVLAEDDEIVENDEIIEEVAYEIDDENSEENLLDEEQIVESSVEDVLTDLEDPEPEKFFYAKKVFLNDVGFDYSKGCEKSIQQYPNRSETYIFYYGDAVDDNDDGIPNSDTNDVVELTQITNEDNLKLNVIEGLEDEKVLRVYGIAFGEYKLSYNNSTITFNIVLPKYGLYLDTERSESNWIESVDSTTGKTLYLIWDSNATAPTSLRFKYNKDGHEEVYDKYFYDISSITNNCLAITFNEFIMDAYISIDILDNDGKQIDSAGIGCHNGGGGSEDSDKIPLDTPIEVKNGAEFIEAVNTIEEYLSGKIILTSDIEINDNLTIVHSGRNEGTGGETIHQGDPGFGLDIDLNGHNITVAKDKILTLTGNVIHFYNSQYSGLEVVSGDATKAAPCISGNAEVLINNSSTLYFEDDIKIVNNGGVAILGNGNQINLYEKVSVSGVKGIVLNTEDSFNYIDATENTTISASNDAVTINAKDGQVPSTGLMGKIISTDGAGVVVNSKAKKQTAYDSINISANITAKTAGIKILSGEINVHSADITSEGPGILIDNDNYEDGTFVNIDIEYAKINTGSKPIIKETLDSGTSNVKMIVIENGEYLYESTPFDLYNENLYLRLTGGSYSSDVSGYINSDYYECFEDDSNFYHVVAKQIDVSNEEEFTQAINNGVANIHVIDNISFNNQFEFNIKSLPLKISLDKEAKGIENITLTNISLIVDKNTECLNNNSALTIEGKGKLVYNNSSVNVISLDRGVLKLFDGVEIENKAGTAIKFKSSEVNVGEDVEVIGRTAIYIDSSDSTSTHLSVFGKVSGSGDNANAIYGTETIYSIMICEPAKISSPSGAAMYLKGKKPSEQNGNPTQVDYNNGTISGSVAVAIDGPVMFNMMSDGAEGTISGTDAAVKFINNASDMIGSFAIGHGTLSSEKDTIVFADGAKGSVSFTGGKVVCGDEYSIIKEESNTCNVHTNVNGGTKFSKALNDNYINDTSKYSCQPVKIIDNKTWYGIVRILKTVTYKNLNVGLYDQNNTNIEISTDEVALSEAVNKDNLSGNNSLDLVLTAEDSMSNENKNRFENKAEPGTIINDILDFNIVETIDKTNTNNVNETVDWQYIKVKWSDLKDENGQNYNNDTKDNIVIYHDHGSISKLDKLSNKDTEHGSSYFYIDGDYIVIATKQFSEYAFGSGTNDYPVEAQFNFYFEGGISNGQKDFAHIEGGIRLGDQFDLPHADRANYNFIGWKDLDTQEEYRTEEDGRLEIHVDKEVYNFEAIWEQSSYVDGIYPFINSDYDFADEEIGGIRTFKVVKGSKLIFECHTLGASIEYKTNLMDKYAPYYEGIVLDGATTIEYRATKPGYKALDSSVNIKYRDLDDFEKYYQIDENDKDLCEDGIPEGIWVGHNLDGNYYYDKENDYYTYSGESYYPIYNVYYGNRRVPTSVTYKNNIKAGTATATIKLIGDYTGTITKTFEIEQRPLSEEDCRLINDTFEYTGKKIKAPALYYSLTKLKEGTDYTVEYSDTKEGAYIDEGTYELVYSGIGNYNFEISKYINICKKKSIEKVKVTGVVNYNYDDIAELIKNEGEKAIQKDIVVKDGTKVLTRGNNEYDDSADYFVGYYTYDNAGTVYIDIKATNGSEYCGSKQISFKINGVALSKAKFDIKNPTIDPKNPWDCIVPEHTITYGEKVLNEEQENQGDVVADYRIKEIINNDKAGKATIVFEGLHKYTGTVKKTFNILPYDISTDLENVIDYEYENYVNYQKGGAKPNIDVFVHYSFTDDQNNTIDQRIEVSNSITYKNNTKIGEASAVIKGTGNFKGQVTIPFSIKKASLNRLRVVAADKGVSTKANQYATTITITDDNGKKLAAGTDYDKNIVYRYASDVMLDNGIIRRRGEVIQKTDIIPLGTVLSAEITGKGNYVGNAYAEYMVIANDISKATVSIPTQYYKGKEVTLDYDQISVKLNGIYLTKKDFEIVGYENNWQKGSATVTIKGRGNYGGMKSVKYKIDAASADCSYVFNGNGSTSGSISTIKLTATSKPKTLTYANLTKFKRIGYKLIGFDTNPHATNLEIDLNDTSIKTNGVAFVYDSNTRQKVYYAIWEKEKYTYTYNPGIGKLPFDNISDIPYFVDDETIELVSPVSEIVKDNNIMMKFDGWYSDANLKKKVTSIKRGTTGDLNFYAKWSVLVGMYQENGNWYYQQKDGTLLKSDKPIKVGDKYYCFGKDGVRIENNPSYVAADGKTYWINDDGTVALNDWAWETDTDGNRINYRHFNSKGVLETGLKTYTELDSYTGKKVKNTYYLDPNNNGIRVCNEGDYQVDKSSKRYYFNEEGIAIKNDVIPTDDGRLFYLDANGQKVKNKFVELFGTRFYFDADGYTLLYDFDNIENNWKLINKKTYFVCEDGSLATNSFREFFDEDKPYLVFFDKNSQLLKGWATVDTQKIYADENNHLVMDCYKIINNKWYRFFWANACTNTMLESDDYRNENSVQREVFDANGLLTATYLHDTGDIQIVSSTAKKVSNEYRIYLSEFSDYREKPLTLTIDKCSVMDAKEVSHSVEANIVNGVDPYISINMEQLTKYELTEKTVFGFEFDLSITSEDTEFERNYSTGLDCGTKLIRISH